MQLTSAIAIYFLLWVFSGLIVLPFGVRTHEEAGVEKIPGQADSAPAHFRPGRILLRTTALAAVLFALFYLNYTMGWITAADMDFFTVPPDIAAEQSLTSGHR